MRERYINWSFYLFMHSLFPVCTLTGNQTHNLGVSGSCSNKLSYPNRAKTVEIFISIEIVMTAHKYIILASTVLLTIVKLPAHERRMSSHFQLCLYNTFSFSPSVCLLGSAYPYFISLDAIVYRIVSTNFLLIVIYGNTGLWMLTLYPETLLHLLINNTIMDSLGFSTYGSSVNMDHFFLPF